MYCFIDFVRLQNLLIGKSVGQPANPGLRGKRSLKRRVRVCVCMCVVEMSAVLLRAGDESEVRHRHNAGDSAEHGDDVDRALRRAAAADRRSAIHQHRLHRHLHPRMRHQAHRPALVLLPPAVERLRLHRRHYLHSR